jgi:hypothetical protein
MSVFAANTKTFLSSSWDVVLTACVYAALDFNNMSTAMDFEKAFEETWRLGLLHKLFELKFSISLI